MCKRNSPYFFYFFFKRKKRKEEEEVSMGCVRETPTEKIKQSWDV